MQIPSAIRKQFELETTQTLEVIISLANHIGAGEKFYAKMRKDGCLTIPQASLFLLGGDPAKLENEILDATVGPA